MGSPIFSLLSIGGIQSFLQSTASQSTSLNQGCSFIDSASLQLPSLFYGFWLNSFLIRSLKTSGVFFGNLMTPALTRSQSSALVSAQKGGKPVQSQQRTTPYSYQSAILLCPFLLIIQRGRQAGVPQKDLLISSKLSDLLLSPKSVIRAWPYLSKTMFQGFRSLQRILFLWRAQRPSKISQAQFLTYFSSNFLRFSSSLDRSPPSQQSITKKRQVSVWNAYLSLTMKGWLIKDRIYFSVWMYLYRLVPNTLSFLIAFSAKNLSFPSFLTRYTSPKAPSPILLQNLKLERVMVSTLCCYLMNWYILKMFCFLVLSFYFSLLCTFFISWGCSGTFRTDICSIFYTMALWLVRFLYSKSIQTGFFSSFRGRKTSKKLALLDARSTAVIPLLFLISQEAPWAIKAQAISLQPSSAAQCKAVLRSQSLWSKQTPALSKSKEFSSLLALDAICSGVSPKSVNALMSILGWFTSRLKICMELCMAAQCKAVQLD